MLERNFYYTLWQKQFLNGCGNKRVITQCRLIVRLTHRGWIRSKRNIITKFYNSKNWIIGIYIIPERYMSKQTFLNAFGRWTCSVIIYFVKIVSFNSSLNSYWILFPSDLSLLTTFSFTVFLWVPNFVLVPFVVFPLVRRTTRTF